MAKVEFAGPYLFYKNARILIVYITTCMIFYKYKSTFVLTVTGFT